MEKVNVVVVVEKDCRECPYCETDRTPRGGFALDYHCKKINKQIMGYIEWESEIKPIPDWCPFK